MGKTTARSAAAYESDFFAAETRVVSDADRNKTLAALAATVSGFYDSSKWRRLPDGMVLVMPEGFGKSFLTVHLVKRRFKFVICCKWNAQVAAKAKEIASQWPANPEVVRLLKERDPVVVRYNSREQHFREVLSGMGIRETDFRLTNYPATSPYASRTVDEPATVSALASAFVARAIDANAADVFVSDGVKLTHCGGVKATHLGQDGGFDRAVDVDPGERSGDTCDGPQGRRREGRSVIGSTRRLSTSCKRNWIKRKRAGGCRLPKLNDASVRRQS